MERLAQLVGWDTSKNHGRFRTKLGAVLEMHVLVISRAFILIVALGFIVFGSPAVQALNTCESVFGRGHIAVLTAPQLAKRLGQMAELVGQSTELRLGKGESNDEALALELRERAREVLGLTRAQWGTSQGGEFDLVMAEGDSVLNRLAVQINRAYGANLIIWPERLVLTGAQAAMIEVTFSGKRTPMLMIGASSLAAALAGKDLLRDPLILHELRHLKIYRELEDKVPSPFYGNILAIEGRIPDASHPNFSAYGKYLSFDECLTYHQQTKQAILDLRLRIRAGASQASISEAMETLGSAISYGYVLSDRTRQVGTMIETFAAARPMNYEITSDGVVTAKKTVVAAGKNKLEIQLPLIASHGASDPKNQQHLMQQLGLMIKKSSLESDQFFAVLQLFTESQKQSKDGRITVADLDRMQSLLNPAVLKP